MLPKVKAQVTRLHNYLVNELGAKYAGSKSTNSRYYKLNNIQIRISDHSERRTNCLNIFIPFNDPNSFIIEHNYTISILKSLKEVKAFLHSLLYIQSVYQENFSSNYEQRLSEKDMKIAELELELEKSKIYTNKLNQQISNRNQIIVEMSERVREAENLALGDPQNVIEKKAIILNKGDILEDSIIMNNKIYPLKEFGMPFKHKILNIIKNNNTLKQI